MSTTALSGDAVLQQAYDPPTESIKVLATITSPPGGSDVNIHDAAGNALTSTAGALNVNSSGTSTVSGTVNTNLNGLTAFQTSQYTVGTAAVQLAPTPLSGRSSLSIKVSTAGSQDVVYVGNSSGVTTATGYALFDGDSLQLDVTSASSVYAIASAAGQQIYVIEVGT